MAMIQSDPHAQVLAALRFLAGECDGAHERDNHGFNKADAQFGKSLAVRNHLTPAMYQAAVKMLQKYRKRQLGPAGLELPLVVASATADKEEELFNPDDYEIPDDYSSPEEDDFFFDEEEPQPTPEPAKPAPRGRAVEDLRNGGTLSRSLPGYQERDPQLEMAALVEEAITEKKHAIIEAATGTGKSLGYLIPAVRAGKRVVVSTANKALQDQLFNKDVPFLQKHLQSFKAALVKGMGNYICLDRLGKERTEGLSVFAPEPVLDQVVEALEGDWNGDFENLPFQVNGELKAKINGDADECARRKCPLYGQCKYFQMRAAAKNADVIITNHAFLMLDTVSGGKLLPERDVVVVDEAHMLENVAVDAFTIEITGNKIFKLLSNKKLIANVSKEVHKQALELADTFWTELERRFPQDKKVTRHALQSPIESGKSLAKILLVVAAQMKETFVPSSDKEEALFGRLIERCNELSDQIHSASKVAGEEYVYYLEKSSNKKGESLTLFVVPLSVAELLKKSLFQDNKVILTSATLSTPGDSGEPDFSFFKRQIGLDGALERILPLVFDYEQNSLLYVPDDLDEPAYGNLAEARKYEAALSKRMLDLVEASRGRAFLLFTSRRMMDIVERYIRPTLERDQYTVLVQGKYPTSEMIKQFKESDKAVLFGLRTFWEGVDVQGEKLSLVVIDKIPFLPFDDPVNRAKERYIERLTGPKTAFSVYGLPMATLPLKQGIGRLLRDVNDTGVMVICDTRLFSKPYGKKILACLPPARLVRKMADVQSFFAAPPRVVEVAPVVEEAQTVAEAVQEVAPAVIEETPVIENEPEANDIATLPPVSPTLAAGSEEPTVMMVVEPEQSNTLKFALPRIANKGGKLKGGIAKVSAWIKVAFKLSCESDNFLKWLKSQDSELNKSAFIDNAIKATPEYQLWLKQQHD